jgi:hypothetical protein
LREYFPTAVYIGKCLVFISEDQRRVFNQVAQGVDYQWTPQNWHTIAMSLIYCFVKFAAGLVVFSKRDFNG